MCILQPIQVRISLFYENPLFFLTPVKRKTALGDHQDCPIFTTSLNQTTLTSSKELYTESAFRHSTKASPNFYKQLPKQEVAHYGTFCYLQLEKS